MRRVSLLSLRSLSLGAVKNSQERYEGTDCWGGIRRRRRRCEKPRIICDFRVVVLTKDECDGTIGVIIINKGSGMQKIDDTNKNAIFCRFCVGVCSSIYIPRMRSKKLKAHFEVWFLNRRVENY